MLLYFVKDDVDFNGLGAIGLGHICDKPSSFSKRQVLGGPFGCNWAIGSTETIAEPRIGYFPNRQELKDFGKFVIARDTETTFCPDALLRANAVGSHPWQDWAGNTWQIPIAQRWIDGDGNPMLMNALPRFLSIGDSGEWEFGGVLPRHEKLWNLAAKFYSDRIEASLEATGDTFTVPIPPIDEVCEVVFGANYRVGRYELSFLKTLLPSSVYEIMKLVIDEPGFIALQKKTA